MSNQSLEVEIYAQKMLRRGDSWADVHRDLSRQNIDQQGCSEIMARLWAEVKKGVIQTPPAPKAGVDFSSILGLLLLAAGIGLAIMLWNRGFISTVPIIIIGGSLLQILSRQGNRRL